MKKRQPKLLAAAHDSVGGWSQLNGALRLVEEMSVRRGTEAQQLLQLFVAEGGQGTLTAIPDAYQLAQVEEEQVIFRGVLAVPLLACPEVKAESGEQKGWFARFKRPSRGTTSEAEAILWETLRDEGMLHPSILAAAIFTAALSVFVETILLRGLMEIGIELSGANERTVAVVAILGFIFLIAFLNWQLEDQADRFGRRLDMRLRQAMFRLFPKLSDQYFQRLAPAEITGRIFGLGRIPQMSESVGTILPAVVRMVLITIGIAWIDWTLVIVNYAFMGLLALFYQLALPTLYRSMYRTTAVNAGIGVQYTDSLRGRSAIWSHGAEHAMRYEYEQGLTRFARLTVSSQKVYLVLVAVTLVVSTLSPIVQLVLYTLRGGAAVSLLLLFYWISELNWALCAGKPTAQSVHESSRAK